MKIAICDDNPADRKVLEDLLDRYAVENGIDVEINRFASGEELLAAYEEYQGAELIFFDIYMGGMDGMEAARRLRAAGFAGEILFSTTGREYAVEGYQVRALGYLVKPYGYEELSRYMGWAVQKIQENVKSLQVTYKRIDRKIFYNEILYIETEGRNSIIATTKGKVCCRKSLSELSDILCKEPNFLRCHRSAILNLNYVMTADKTYVEMVDGQRLPMNIKNGKKLCRQMAEYFSQQLSNNFFKDGEYDHKHIPSF